MIQSGNSKNIDPFQLAFSRPDRAVSVAKFWLVFYYYWESIFTPFFVAAGICCAAVATLKQRNLLAIFIIKHAVHSPQCGVASSQSRLPHWLQQVASGKWQLFAVAPVPPCLNNHKFAFLDRRAKNSFSARFQCVKNNIIFFIAAAANWRNMLPALKRVRKWRPSSCRKP